MSLLRHGAVFVFQMERDENRIGPELLDELEQAMLAVERAEAPRALVTVGVDRFYSNGFDLEGFADAAPGEFDAFTVRAEVAIGRLLVAPYTTVAAINGHCYAAGALLALAHDMRVMRSDRGYFCLPAVDIGIPFTRGMTELIAAKIPAPTAADLVVTGRRYGGEEAARLRIVHEAVDGDEVLARAVDLAEHGAGKDPATLGTIKRRFYAIALEHLRHGAT